MASISKIRSANITAGSSLPYRPVAVFVGGTSGIGAGMARAFAIHRNGDAHIVIIGRNRAAAEEVIASFPKPDGKEIHHEFVECDITLMRNVRRVASELVQRLPKINFLVLSAGMMTMKGRDETDEGIDKKLALHYYARWRFTEDLMPSLQKAVDAGEDAKVMSVLSGSIDGTMDVNDLGLKKTFSVGNAASAASAYNNAMVQSFAEKHPDMAFTHIVPGVVRTNLMSASNDWKIRMMNPLAQAITYLAGVSPDDCGEYMWRGLYAGKTGWSRRNAHGDEITPNPSLFTQQMRDKLWKHTLEVTS